MTATRETALLLNQVEWDDLAHICNVYRQEHEVTWSTLDEVTQERLKLAQRIKDRAWGTP